MNIVFDSILNKDGRIYFYERVSNSICEGLPDFSDIHIVRRLFEDVETTNFGAMGIFEYQDKIFIGNQFGSDVLIFDTKENIFHREYPMENELKKNLFYHTVCVQNKIFQIPTDLSEKYYVFDMTDKTFRLCDSIINESLIARFSYLKENDLYLTISESSRVLRWNLGTNKTEWIEFGADIRINNVCIYNDKMYGISSVDGSLYIKDGEQLSTVKICEENNPYIFSRVFAYKDNIYMLPRHSNYLYTYDVNSCGISLYEIASVEDYKDDDPSTCFGYSCNGNTILLFPWGGDGVKIFNIDERTIKKTPLKYRVNYEELTRMKLLTENEGFNIKHYLTGICENGQAIFTGYSS